MENNETREILEQQFTAAAEMHSPDEQPVAAGEQIPEAVPQTVEEYSSAPVSYKKEYAETFKSLPPEWRKYLTERESEAEKGFSRLNNEVGNRKWIDDVFTPRQERLKANGIQSSKQWVEGLASIEDALENNPHETIKAIAEAYGINLNSQEPQQPEGQDFRSLAQKLSSLEQGFTNIQQTFQQQKQSEVKQIFDSFVGAKDETGNPKYPHFEDVRQTMSSLIQSGQSATLEDAYEKSIWLNPKIRENLVKQQTESSLAQKAKEAEKAKMAGFSPKGKIVPAEENLSTRQILEKEILGRIES